MLQILHSSAFYTNPSALKGSARLADLFGDLDTYNYDKSQEKEDSKALQRDWTIVGTDIKQAIKSYEKSNSQQTAKKSE